MTWHPQAIRDPHLAGENPVWCVGCDPGRPTGLALLHCSRTGEVHAATATLQFGAHPTPSGNVVSALHCAMWDAFCMTPPSWKPYSDDGRTYADPRGGRWEYAGEEMGAVYERKGTDHATAQGKRLSLQRVARLEGQIAEAVAGCVALRGEALYESGEWRKLLGASRAAAEVAKALAVGFVERQFGATVSDHEAEALCIGLWHLRVLRMGERAAERTPPPTAKKSKRALPPAVLAAAERGPAR